MMPHSQQTPYNIKIHPAVLLPFQHGKERPISDIAREIYKYLWDNATFGHGQCKASSHFITHQKIAEKFQYHLSIIHQAITELVEARKLKPHRDGYLVLIKEGAV